MGALAASRLLAVDVGNSRIKFGMFELSSAEAGAAGVLQLPELMQSLAVAPDGRMPWEEIGGWLGELSGGGPGGIVAGSNPAVRDRVVDDWPVGWAAPRVLTDAGCLGLEVRTADVVEANQTGIDRLLNAVAVNRLVSDSRPAIIIDSGTATTVDAVDADGVFLGGAILPGFGLLARSLHRYTALLPLLTLEELGADPIEAVGQDTRAAIRSGLFFGQLGAVRELVRAMLDSFKSEIPELFLTGGGGPLLATALTEARLVPHLGLRGLAEVALGDDAGRST
jgi:type III pantothenate kinase